MGMSLTDEERKNSKGWVGQAYRALLDPAGEVVLDRATADFLLRVLGNMHHLETYADRNTYARAVARQTMESGRREDPHLDLFRLEEEDNR